MKKGVMIGGIVIILLVLSAGLYFFTNPYTPNQNQNNSNPPSSGPSENTVNIEGFAFNPSELTIKVGDTVTWNNMGTVPHTITSDSGTELNSQTIMVGNSYSHIFNTAGTYTYHCSIHTSMKGTIIVE